MIINYDCYHRFIVLATINMIVNYDCKLFIVQATGKACQGKTLNSYGLFNQVGRKSFHIFDRCSQCYKTLFFITDKEVKISYFFLSLASFSSLIYYL